MQVTVDGLVTQYQRRGKGKTVVFLHGWGDSLASFYDLSRELSPQYDTICLDLPGFGQTQTPGKVWGLDDYAAFVKKFLQKNGIKEPYALVAHSNGGAVAIRGLAKGTLKTKKVILLSASGVIDRQKVRKKAVKLVTKTGKALTLPLPARWRESLRERFYRSIGSNMLLPEHMEATFNKTVNQDVTADAARIKMPVLLLYGSQDTNTPPSFGETFEKQIKGSKLHVIDHASHFVHHDQPARVAQLVKNFLKP